MIETDRPADDVSDEAKQRFSVAQIAFLLTLMFYMQLLIGGVLATLSFVARDWFSLTENPLSLELLFVAVPLLSGLFVFAYSDNKNWGMDGFARDLLAETVLFLTFLLLVAAGSLQTLSKATKCDSAIVANLYLQGVDIPEKCESLIPASWADVITFGGSLDFLQVFFMAPLHILADVFDFETLFYFLIVMAISLILLEAHGILVTSDTGIREEGRRNSRQIIRIQRRIADRLVLRRFRVLLALYVSEAPDTVDRGLDKASARYGAEVGLRLLRLVAATLAALLWFLIWKALGSENPHLLSYTWLYLLIMAFSEAAWLRPNVRSLTGLSSVGILAILILYFSVSESSHDAKQTYVAIAWLLLLLGIRLLRTFVSMSSIPTTYDLRWCVRNSTVGPAGARRFISRWFFNMANHRFGLPKKWMQNQVAWLLYRRQMNEDIRRHKEMVESLDGHSPSNMARHHSGLPEWLTRGKKV